MKAIWTGSIGFGLVNIPVKLYSATEDSSIDLDMLDSKDHSRILFKRVNAETGKEVAWENIVKAYNYDGNYIILDNADFEVANPEKSKVIAIERFVDLKEIESVYYESPYYLEPQKNAESAYALLMEAMKKTGKAGLGSFVMRTKESLGILKPYEDVIIFQRIRYAQEIRDSSEIKVPKKQIKPAEMKMAVSLIESMADDFKIEEFEDQYSSSLMKVIEEKAKGKKGKPVAKKVVHTKTADLMEQLKASLAVKNKKAKAS